MGTVTVRRIGAIRCWSYALRALLGSMGPMLQTTVMYAFWHEPPLQFGSSKPLGAPRRCAGICARQPNNSSKKRNPFCAYSQKGFTGFDYRRTSASERVSKDALAHEMPQALKDKACSSTQMPSLPVKPTWNGTVPPDARAASARCGSRQAVAPKTSPAFSLLPR